MNFILIFVLYCIFLAIHTLPTAQLDFDNLFVHSYMQRGVQPSSRVVVILSESQSGEEEEFSDLKVIESKLSAREGSSSHEGTQPVTVTLS